MRDYSEEINVLNAIIRETEANIRRADRLREQYREQIKHLIGYSYSDRWQEDRSLSDIRAHATSALNKSREVNVLNHRIFALQQVLKLLERMHVDPKEAGGEDE